MPEQANLPAERPDHDVLVERLAGWLRAKLDQNRHKGSWRGTHPERLLRLLAEEVVELIEAVRAGQDAWPEAADVAAYAAIVADAHEWRRLQETAREGGATWQRLNCSRS